MTCAEQQYTVKMVNTRIFLICIVLFLQKTNCISLGDAVQRILENNNQTTPESDQIENGCVEYESTQPLKGKTPLHFNDKSLTFKTFCSTLRKNTYSKMVIFT